MLSEKLSKAKFIDKDKLKRNIDKWKEIGTIHSDYEIPFISNLPTMYFCNNKSAIHNAEFVPSEISDLLKNKDI